MTNKNDQINAEQERKIPVVWRQAFRPFFLAGALFSVLALAAWAAVLTGRVTFSPYGSASFWHAHEMLFGYVAAIIVGFLLTAVQNWTGLRAIRGRPLILLFSIWLIARFLMATNLIEQKWIVALVDVSFLPVAGIFMAHLVIKAGNYRNLFFVPVLILLAVANLLTHLSVILGDQSYYKWGLYAAVMLVSALMTVIGGRVIPMFTANGTGTQKVNPLAWLEKTVLISTWLIAFLYISNTIALLPTNLLAALFAIAAMSHAYRALRWRPWVIWSSPLVWSLHLAYWFLPLGFGLFAMHYFGVAVSSSTAIHSFTAGAMGSLTFSMIARVSLGHTGRPLVTHPSMTYAFVLILLAGLSRLITGLFPSAFTSNGYMLSAIFWILAFVIYLLNYVKILVTPRPDGGPG
ncbi:MAG: NnrS family protein [Pseudomonadales bacterium]|nr:NnrS family protein [Pseudomonadales bacterium]